MIGLLSSPHKRGLLVLCCILCAAEATDLTVTTPTSTLAPWASWSLCTRGTWRCEGGCYHPQSEQCISLPGLDSQTNERILALECDAKGGVYGHVCNCKCTEQLHCKFGCYDLQKELCEDVPEERCYTTWRGRQRNSWEKRCRCIEVTSYYTTFAENVTLSQNSGGLIAAHLTLLAKVAFLSRLLA
mmetsp:Transcript_53531/g.125309  ORF Transcript_53531/g.125309 Transcript_53531/m.125309 type:complete len:186 (+) Transcript_53531:86-643(+)